MLVFSSRMYICCHGNSMIRKRIPNHCSLGNLLKWEILSFFLLDLHCIKSQNFVWWKYSVKTQNWCWVIGNVHITRGRWCQHVFNFCKRSLDIQEFMLTLLDMEVTNLNHRAVFVNMHSHFTIFAAFHKIYIIFLYCMTMSCICNKTH